MGLTKKDMLKQALDSSKRNGIFSKMVVAVKLPTGATELIINTELIDSKVDYYLNAYDDDLRLKTNSAISIVSYLFA